MRNCKANAWRGSLTLSAFLAAFIAICPADHALAKPKICPQFLMKFCVMDKSGLIFTAETNACFASEQGLRILYAGTCKIGRISPPRTCAGTACM